MRARKVHGVVAASVLVLLASTGLPAHRRDEYLQAARIALQPDAVVLQLDVTPGVDVADDFLRSLDRDGDGVLSPVEQRGYSEQVVAGLSVGFDGQPLRARLVSATFPDPDEIRRGVGVIRLHANAAVAEMPAGIHRVSFGNGHQADHSAYLANALVPDDSNVSVTAQRRTVDQRELTIEYAVGAGAGTGQATWFLVSLAMAAIVMVRARSGDR